MELKAWARFFDLPVSDGDEVALKDGLRGWRLVLSRPFWGPQRRPARPLGRGLDGDRNPTATWR